MNEHPVGQTSEVMGSHLKHRMFRTAATVVNIGDETAPRNRLVLVVVPAARRSPTQQRSSAAWILLDGVFDSH